MGRTAAILVNYNGSDDTSKCLRSLYASDMVPRIVVVDNTPDDPDLAAVMAEYPEVHMVRAPGNLGFGAGNNLGIEWVLSRTDCEFIFIFNNDAAVEADTLERLEAVLDAHPEVGIAAPRIVFMNNASMLWYGGGEVSWLRGSAVTPGFLGPSDAQLAMTSRRVSFASGCAMLIRRELLEKIGGFDDRFFMYEEDVELCLRAKENGYQIWYEASALVHHVSHGVFVSDRSLRNSNGYVGTLSPLNSNLPFYVFHQVRNRLLNMKLHAKRHNRLLFFMGFSLLLLRKIVQFSISKRWDGILAIFRGSLSYIKMRKV